MVNSSSSTVRRGWMRRWRCCGPMSRSMGLLNKPSSWPNPLERRAVAAGVAGGSAFTQFLRWVSLSEIKSEHIDGVIRRELGSRLIMAGGTQRFWVHQVPKSAAAAAPRVNLSFRHMIP
jgi:hypothetical protein